MNLTLFVGTYTRSAEDPGIFLCRFDDASPNLSVESSFVAGANPSYLTVDSGGRFLYAVNELGYDDAGSPQGGVSAFSVDEPTGALALVNRQPTLGADPCHLALDESGRRLFVANFRSGSVTVIPINANGSLGDPLQSVQHRGAADKPEGTVVPHAHSVAVAEGNRFAFVADLGLDQIMSYVIDPSEGTLRPHDPACIATTRGAGPRHMDFHPRDPWLYIVNERDSTVYCCKFDPQEGTLTKVQEVTSLPGHWHQKNSGADIHISPDGRFLYASNRGHDSIAIFEIDQTTGFLRGVGHESSGGAKPRNFLITPSGSHLMVANQDSDSVVVFQRDRETGLLRRTGAMVEIPAPVCLKVWETGKPRGEFK